MTNSCESHFLKVYHNDKMKNKVGLQFQEYYNLLSNICLKNKKKKWKKWRFLKKRPPISERSSEIFRP